jgi:hypothetical protein
LETEIININFKKMKKKTETTMSKLFDVKSNGEIVYWTRNYDLFTLLKGNRPRIENHVKRLVNSILKNGWIRSSQFIVGEKMVLYDGQQRLWALKDIRNKTGETYEVGYKIDREMDLHKIQILNNYTMSWKPTAYIDSNIELGKKDYEFIKELMEQYKLPYTAVLAIITKSLIGSDVIEKFRNGEIKVNNYPEVNQQAKWIGSLKPYFHRYNSKNFVFAMTTFFSNPKFDFDEFLYKLSVNRNLLYPVTTVNEYKKLIQNLYNYHRKDKVKFISI